ncbi:MAG: hypothetical protein WCA22_00650 [Candidatus Binatus sp.]
MAQSGSTDRWPRDFRIFAGLCILWSAVLITRASFNLSAGAPIEDVIFGVKFHGDQARVTMALQAAVIAAFGIGISMRRRWGTILALLYMAQVVAGHVIFITSNLGVEAQRLHVKVAMGESPVVLMIALYVAYRARPLLRRPST